MDMTPERNDNTENSEDRELGSPTPSESPSPPHADLNEWIMQGLNQLNERFNRIEGRLDEIGKDVGRFEGTSRSGRRKDHVDTTD